MCEHCILIFCPSPFPFLPLFGVDVLLLLFDGRRGATHRCTYTRTFLPPSLPPSLPPTHTGMEDMHGLCGHFPCWCLRSAEAGKDKIEGGREGLLEGGREEGRVGRNEKIFHRYSLNILSISPFSFQYNNIL